jgi:hypothetical protein
MAVKLPKPVSLNFKILNTNTDAKKYSIAEAIQSDFLINYLHKYPMGVEATAELFEDHSTKCV